MSESRQLWLDVVKMRIANGCEPEYAIGSANNIVDAYEGRFNDRPCPPEPCDAPAHTYREVHASDIGSMIEVRMGREDVWHDRVFVGFDADARKDGCRFVCTSIYDNAEVACWKEARVRVF
jgi:hypothetical protein